jgi:hypothetical protein
MSRKLLDYDPLTKTAEWHFYDEMSKKTYIKTVQDVEPILETNKRKQNSLNASRFIKKDDMYHFASVPNSVLLEWKQKYNIDWNRKEDLPKIEKLLMSSEYKYLRTVDRI